MFEKLKRPEAGHFLFMQTSHVERVLCGGGHTDQFARDTTRVLNRVFSMFFPANCIAFSSEARHAARVQASVLGYRGYFFVPTDWHYV